MPTTGLPPYVHRVKPSNIEISHSSLFSHLLSFILSYDILLFLCCPAPPLSVVHTVYAGRVVDCSVTPALTPDLHLRQQVGSRQNSYFSLTPYPPLFSPSLPS